jgi:Putative auto-transporter adhesin, head GIN domain
MKILALLAILPLTACSSETSAAPSGPSVNRSYALDGFSAVKATGPDDVDIRVGSGFSIRAEGDAKLLDKLEIVKNGDTLEVRRKSNSGFSWGGSSDKGIKIYITMPRITAATETGSGNLSVDHVDGDAFKASATGSGDLSIGTLNVQTATLSLTGSGNLSSGGTAKVGDLSITGSGDIEAPKLTLNQASVSVMGSGSVSAAVAGTADVNVMGSGDVTLTGGAKCTTHKMGSGEVSCS